MINKRDNKNSSGIEAERKQVAATLEVAQPKPNASAAPTALQLSCSNFETDLLLGE
jgi:hypothetical protein